MDHAAFMSIWDRLVLCLSKLTLRNGDLLQALAHWLLLQHMVVSGAAYYWMSVAVFGQVWTPILRVTLLEPHQAPRRRHRLDDRTAHGEQGLPRQLRQLHPLHCVLPPWSPQHRSLLHLQSHLSMKKPKKQRDQIHRPVRTVIYLPQIFHFIPP